MFFLVSERNNKYGILDTSDGVVEFYSKQDVLNFVQGGLEISGVSTENGNVTLAITRPLDNKKCADKIYLYLCKMANKAVPMSADLYDLKIRIYCDNSTKYWHSAVLDANDQVIWSCSAKEPHKLDLGFNIIRCIGYYDNKFDFKCNLDKMHITWASVPMAGRKYAA